MGDRLLHETAGLCRTCKVAVPARVVARETGTREEVVLTKACATHGAAEVVLSDDADWYERTRAIEAVAEPPSSPRPVLHGCPFDCGPCTSHSQRPRLPVITITSACNLDCPICYVHNKNTGAYHMSLPELRQVLEHLHRDRGEIDIVNLTGGEPTVHPDLCAMVDACRDAGVRRVTICTNGLRLAKDEALVRRLADLGARVALSFDSFGTEANHTLQGANLLPLKLACLDLLEKHGVDTTLIPVMTRGVNDGEIGEVLRFALARGNVRHVEIHTITYTGQGGASFDRSGRISMREVLARLAEQTGILGIDDFVPSPRAHPLCYQIAYLLVDPAGGAPVPLTRLVDRTTLRACLADHLYLEPSPELEVAIGEALDRVWAEGGDDAPRILALVKRLLLRMFPPGRSVDRAEALAIGEDAFKAIYVHSHMDEDTFDVERVAACCDSNCYPDGSTIPVCASNVLYRETEEHFMLKPVAWSTRLEGRAPSGARFPLRVAGS
ncbi:MAG: radical SAM protein [Acidobacteriota bacterium]